MQPSKIVKALATDFYWISIKRYALPHICKVQPNSWITWCKRQPW